MFIPDPDFSASLIRIPDPGVNKAQKAPDPESGSATLISSSNLNVFLS